MGRKKKDPRIQAAAQSIAEAMQNRSFRGRAKTLCASLKRFQKKRQSAIENDPSAALLDLGWREVKNIEGQLWYTGPYYDLRELCDDFDLPWRESARFLVAACLDSPESLEEAPPPEAWRAWRMARSGLGRPRPDEIALAKEKLSDHTTHGTRRRFDRGLTQEMIARILYLDERTVRTYIAECKRYSRDRGMGLIMDKAGLSVADWPALAEYFDQQRKKPEE